MHLTMLRVYTHSDSVCRVRVHALNEKESGVSWWKVLGEHSDDWCWVGSYNSVYQLDTFLCMRSKLQQHGLAPLIVLDEADAALRTLNRTQVMPQKAEPVCCTKSRMLLYQLLVQASCHPTAEHLQ